MRMYTRGTTTTTDKKETPPAQAALIQAQQRRFEVATTRYRQGEDTYLSVLSAQQDLYSAQQSRLQTKRNKLASQIALYKALGGGWK